MSEDWDFYMCRIEEELASIFLDMSLVHEAPYAGLSKLVCLVYDMPHPREDGLSSKEDAEALFALEDDIIAKIEQLPHRYVGRLTHQGRRSFYLYMAPEHIDEAIRAWGDYALDATIEDDPNWAYYKEWLYPSLAEHQDMSNRQVVLKLHEYGDNLDVPRPVDHSANFEDEAKAQAFVEEIEAEGYEAKHSVDQDRHIIDFTRKDPVTLDHINEVVRQIILMLRKHEGHYDGWGCPVVTN